MTREPSHYQSGFANEFATEALPGALPEGRNSPQRAPYGLYAEQLSGTAFTAPRHANRRSWLYRIRPAAVHEPFERDADDGRLAQPLRRSADAAQPAALGSAADAADTPTDFVDGLVTMAGNAGCGIHLYAANRSMERPLLLRRRRRAADRAAAGPPGARHRARRARRRAAGDRGHPARRALPGAPARRRGARLCLRELRRAVQAARPRRHRLERPGQPARLPDAGRRLRRPRRRVRARRQVPRPPVARRASAIRRSTWSPGTATTRPTSTTCAASTRSARSATTTRTRRSSWCCSRRATRRASTASTSSIFPPRGWRCRTPSARPGSTATSPASSWA